MVDTSVKVKLRAKTPGGNGEVCEFQGSSTSGSLPRLAVASARAAVRRLRSRAGVQFLPGAGDPQSNSAMLLGVFHS